MNMILLQVNIPMSKNDMTSDIDLHIHTNYSDGSFGVEETISLVKARGIRYFSITDHDTLESCKAMNCIFRSALPDSIYFSGVELSCKHKGIDLHILGYECDIENKQLNELIAIAKENRRQKTMRLANYLKREHHIEIPAREKQRLFRQDNNVGKPNFAVILIKMGYGTNVQEVINKYMNAFEAFDLKIEAEEAISVIRKAYGFSVMAHPIVIAEDHGYSYNDIDVLASELKHSGLDAIEVYYSKHSAEQKAEYRKIAVKNGLMMSGGSDFHGKNKPNIRLGDLGEGIDQNALHDVYEFALEMMQ